MITIKHLLLLSTLTITVHAAESTYPLKDIVIALEFTDIKNSTTPTNIVATELSKKIYGTTVVDEKVDKTNGIANTKYTKSYVNFKKNNKLEVKYNSFSSDDLSELVEALKLNPSIIGLRLSALEYSCSQKELIKKIKENTHVRTVLTFQLCTKVNMPVDIPATL